LTNKHETLSLDIRDTVWEVRLARPEVHNAFNAIMIRELHELFDEIRRATEGATPSVRVVVLSGSGPSFCAGADITWMRESLKYSREENRADAARMAAMFRSINEVPVPVIARIHGLALGGGCGLAACADIVLAEANTKFAFSESKLGIAPAVISPFVLAKIGHSHARALFLTAERFSAERALQIGLVHRVVLDNELDTSIADVVREVMSSAPRAVSTAKRLIALVPALPQDAATELTINTIADLRTGAEGQEGLSAFLEKRKPDWWR
jgi:methylglutaconyl-CoA hydratase